MKVAVLSDIHANKEALKAVINDLEKNKCEQILVLGDLVGYYYWPKEVIEYFMRSNKSTVIRGNHEDLFSRCIDNPVFAESCYQKYGSGLNICLQQLSTEHVNWLSLLPESKVVNIDGLTIGLYHGSEKTIDEYLYPDVSRERIEAMDLTLDFAFFGHTHYPVVFTKGNAIVANPGSVGQPRDVGSLASYIILNTKNKALSFKRIPFDSHVICEKAQEIDPSTPYLHEIMKRNNTNV